MDISKQGKGALIKKVDLRDYRLEAIPTAIILPTSFEIVYGGKIKSQNGSGSCVSQATVYLAEILNFKETGMWVDLSPRFVYSSVRLEPMGSYIADNMSFVCNNGIATEAEVPSYENGYPPSEEFMKYKGDITSEIKDNAMSYWARKYVTWDNQNVDMFKKAIYAGSGAVIASWGNNYCWANGDIILPDSPQQMEWRHGVLLLGWNDEKKSFKFINSWGTEWGHQGYGWLPYSYIEKGYVANPLTLVDVPNGTYSILMKLIGLLRNAIDYFKQLKR